MSNKEITRVGKLLVHIDDSLWCVHEILIVDSEFIIVIKSLTTGMLLELSFVDLELGWFNSSAFKIKPPKSGTYWINKNNNIKYKIAENGDYLLIDLSPEHLGKARQYTEDYFWVNFKLSSLEGT